MRKQPNRAERAVDKHCWVTRYADEPYQVINREHAVTLLRKEHAWFWQMVRRLDDIDYSNMSDDYQAGMHHAYCDVLDKLEQRRK